MIRYESRDEIHRPRTTNLNYDSSDLRIAFTLCCLAMAVPDTRVTRHVRPALSAHAPRRRHPAQLSPAVACELGTRGSFDFAIASYLAPSSLLRRRPNSTATPPRVRSSVVGSCVSLLSFVLCPLSAVRC